MPLTNPANLDRRIDTLLVLGRGIDEHGTLSRTGLERAEVAVDIARAVLPRLVVFTGGRSWVQVLNEIKPPSEGGAMLDHALSVMSDDMPEGVRFVAEEGSTSTVANMALSKPLIDLDAADPSIGVLSDALHFSQGRIDYLAELVYPGVEIVPYIIENPSDPTPEAIREESMSTKITRLAMLGVTAGNERAIMRRQRMLEFANTTGRRAVAFAAKRRNLTYFSS